MPPDLDSSFSPPDILPSTCARLVSLYPNTARTVYQTKLEAKTKGSKYGIEGEVRSFMELDRWRYEKIPDILRERAEQKDSIVTPPSKRVKKPTDVSSIGDVLHLETHELMCLMEWKLYDSHPHENSTSILITSNRKHGTFRPALMNLIRSNPESQIHSTTSDAFCALPLSSSDDDDDALFPSTSLSILTKSLRGVGPATASLILSAATASSDTNQVPFFSDELYWWLCKHRYPPSSSARQTKPLTLKYNVKEYRELWDAARQLKARLDGMDSKKNSFSMQDIEKVAFIIGHFEHSGYFDPVESGIDSAPSKPEAKTDKKKNPAISGANANKKGPKRKRKR
ncbi:hypothetical protein PRK78_001139 [Emydomyces testavorans]|uniref:Uncharacterized protein n=1 Tax=Emydomyces testavorans TaxID=2070801 RepID=A0AAF0IGK8_9EURO|nr:hypothetical protein PRK78_001139 [Emydomyces testavorans]